MTDLPADTDMDALPSTMFDRVIRALDVAYYEWTVGSEKIRVSSALADMFGFDTDTWTVKRQTELMHPDDRPGFRAALAAGFKSAAERVEFTYRMRRSDGDYRWLINRGVLERDDAGRVTRLTGAVSDITEAKHREAQNRNLIASQTTGVEHQSATIDVLKAMSSSPGNAQPVLELIVRRACEVCGAPSAAFYQFDGKLVHFQAEFGAESVMAHGALEAYRRQFPMPPTRGSFAMRAILDREIVHIRDIAAESGVLGTVRDLGHKSNLSLPLLRNGEVIGSISLSGSKTGGFTGSQVELLKTFAEQAVIAIGSAETYRELQERTAALARRNSEYGERIEQQSATIDVLKVMSASPGDVQPVFGLIAERARTFCEADSSAVVLFDGKLMHLQSHSGLTGQVAQDYEARFPQPANSSTVFGRSILARDAVHLRDTQADPEFSMVRLTEAMALRSLVGVPMLRAGVPIGAITLARVMPGGFSAVQEELLRTFAEQAVIAIGSAETYRELQERTAALAERNIAFSEQVEHQSATIDVLKAMSASPGDAQPVFDLIVRRAAEVCNAPNAVLFRYDGELLHWQATSGAEAFASPEAFEALRRQFPMAPSQESSIGRSILSRRISHVRDIDADPDLYQQLRDIGMKSLAGVPLLRDGVPLGVIGLSAKEPGGFSDSQVALLETFAEQAVIAIGSAETYRALQERTAALTLRNSEYGERIEQQAATIDVLKVMSSSQGDAQPVFELITRRALEFCGATGARLIEFDGQLQHLRSLVRADGIETEADAALRLRYPAPPDHNSLAGRVILQGNIVHTHDAAEVPPGMQGRYLGSVVGVPLSRDGRVIGAILLSRAQPGGYSETQIALLETFAEQAVIAIGSAETYRELQERTAALALRNSEYGERIEHQSATIDVLKAMSGSPDATQMVFDLITSRARKLCDGALVGLFEFDGELVHVRSSDGILDHTGMNSKYPMRLTRETISNRAILDRRTIHVRDVDGDSELSQVVRDSGSRSILSVPLMRDEAAIGAIALNGLEPGGFSDGQVALLQTFAEQAVIAIGSAETYRALQQRTEALTRSVAELRAAEAELLTANAALDARNSEYGEQIQHQSATIDVLKVMSASPGDPRPVFDLIVRRAKELCNGMGAGLFEYDGSLMRVGATFGGDSAAISRYEAMFPMAPARESLSGRAILDSRIVHIRDMIAEPRIFQAVRDMGAKTTISLPLLRDGVPIGAISLNSQEPDGFSDSQVALLRTFAEQAVIAISSAETYRELQARTAALAQRNSEFGERIEQQSATIDVLKAMSNSPDDTQPVFDLIARRAAELCEARAGLWEFDGTLMHYRAGHGMEPETTAAFARQFPRPPDSGTVAGRSILGRQVIHIPNIAADAGISQAARDLGGSAIVSIPLLREGQPMGAIALNGRPPAGFSDSQIALLQTFAEQAVIAITSVASYRALRERTAELTRSVAELHALEEVLRAVNSSLDVDTVLSTIISRAVRLSLSDEGTIYEYDPIDEVFVPKSAFGMSQERVVTLRERRIRLGETHLGRSALLRAPVAVDDVQQDPSLPEASTALPGIHAVLAVPLLREDAVIGGLVIRRRREDGFAPNLVTLMQTFAGQAVLAIENARLFQEARQARTAAEATLADLRRAQDRLVQSEKMASLGQLTAGIAHEIKNPLNFVNNFSDLSVDLLDELHDAVAPNKIIITAELRAEIDDLTATLKGNLEKIAQHGRRADSIVKNMLLHSRSGPSEHRAIDLNTTVEEALNLAYHGARAETPGFNITMEKQLDPQTGVVELYPQEFTRLMLNLIGNGFYAARRRAEQTPDQRYEPTLRLTTRDLGEQVEIRVCDNGTGISDAVREKIFEPFFTTKPAGEGTGLGLSLSYDIVVKQHGGQLTVDSRPGAFTEFIVILPRKLGNSARVRT